MKKVLLFLPVLALILSACSKESENDIILRVASQKGTCHVLSNYPCYIVKYPGSDTWERMAEAITKFDYEAGYEYTLKVVKRTRKNPPQDWMDSYELKKIISKVQKDSENLPPPAPWENPDETPDI